jgi:hypothetical protein
MATVVERLGHTIEGGRILYDERPATYEQADKIAGRRLDRRKNYCILNGEICESVSWTQGCSGCSSHYGELGCHECGYTGKRLNAMWVPISTATRKSE